MKIRLQGILEDLTERIVIDYANLSGRESANRATFRMETKKHLDFYIDDILTDYSDWLNKKGYLDSDYYTEEPKAVEEYIRQSK